jgi:dihydrofolate reductase
MRRLIVTSFSSLDGVAQAPGNAEEDSEGGFAYGGWIVPHFDEHMGEVMTGLLERPFALLLGRRTYDIFAAHWPHAEEEVAAPLNDATKYVASRGRPELTWQNSVLLDGDAGEAVARLKESDGPDLQVHGSMDLVQTLLGHRLVDELWLWTFPVVLGSGKRLFGNGTVPAALRLTDRTESTTGVMIATYELDGDVPTGSFGPE